MHTLSPQAQRRRRSDMLALTEDDPDYWFTVRILVIGISILVVQYVQQMAHYNTPRQRAVLVALGILAGGALLVFLITYQLVWLALVIAFGPGVLIATIARL